MEYTCQVCYDIHKYNFEIKTGPSKTLLDIRKENFKRVFEGEKNYFLVDKSIAVFPGIIYLNTNFETPLSIETWVECNWETFVKMSENYIKYGTSNLIEGKLYDKLDSYYENMKGLECEIEFFPNMKAVEKAQIYILEESEIKMDQTKGLPDNKLLELMQIAYHQNKIN